MKPKEKEYGMDMGYGEGSTWMEYDDEARYFMYFLIKIKSAH